MKNYWSNENNKPEIVGLVEDFENNYKGQKPKSELFEIACSAIAVFLFGPIEDKDLDVYKKAIKLRVEKYREVTN